MAKTTPIGIRFDTEKLELVKIKERLDSPQKVVNFLLENYWWQNRLLKTAQETQAALPYIKQEEPEKSPFEAYKEKIGRAANIEECRALGEAGKIDPALTGWQRRAIEQQAIEKSKSFDF